MPIIPKYQHPLRRVRKILNLEQKELAERLGVSTPTIVAVENGTLRISRSLATKIYLKTGAIPESIVTPTKGTPGYSKRRIDKMIPLGPDRRPLTSDSARITKEPDGPENELCDIFDARNLLDVLLQAASEKGNFKEVLISFFGWLEDTQTQFSLETKARTICANYQPPGNRFIKLRRSGTRQELDADRQFLENMTWYKFEGWPTDLSRRWLRRDILTKGLESQKD